MQDGGHGDVGFARPRRGAHQQVDVAVERRLVDLALDAVEGPAHQVCSLVAILPGGGNLARRHIRFPW